MHPPLLDALEQLDRDVLKKGQPMYHGCMDFSNHTDYENKLLKGSRKWLSLDPFYAQAYCFSDNYKPGARLLWVCKLTTDVPVIIGNQEVLKEKSPWGDSFRSEFPDHFRDYAAKLLPESKAYGFRSMSGQEWLITDPTIALEVIEVIVLSSNTPNRIATEVFLRAKGLTVAARVP